MKRMILLSWLLVCAVPFAARADHEIDWNHWYEGDVQVRLRVDRGEGALYGLGQPLGLKLEATEDAYHLVYAIDPDGYVRLLFPRAWEDDGWLFAHEELRLQSQDLAWPAGRWGSGGIVYVEAVASPVPFDFTALGVVLRAGHAGWVRQGRPFRVQGDPFLAFNEVHRVLFPAWDQAVFAVDYTYFYVDRVMEAPRYLGYSYQRVYLPPPTPTFSVGLRFVWHWEFGRRYCRPIYPRYYVPGRHVVHHPMHGHHHVIYRSPAPRPVHRRPPDLLWVAPGPKRVQHEPPVVRQRQRSSEEPRRDRERPSQPHVERRRSVHSVAEVAKRSVEARRETPERPTAGRPTRQRDASPSRTSVLSEAKRRVPAPRGEAQAVRGRGESKPSQAVEKRDDRGRRAQPASSKAKAQKSESQEKKRKRR